ncbi:hypothetical protein KEJ21_05410 [Candidatus Bathyarchaeota archaeon]|nr:hypothetical protein [Candidatus Bathyarchaeota archaeon]MBS7630440.1 hypothetical protein [Candidatus Bathyarchaeota archaeon]
MRLIEKKLVEINSRIKIYTAIYNQCSNKLEAMRRTYLNSMNFRDEILIDEDLEYQKEADRMRLVSRRLEELNKEKDKLRKILEDNMHRF